MYSVHCTGTQNTKMKFTTFSSDVCLFCVTCKSVSLTKEKWNNNTKKTEQGKLAMQLKSVGWQNRAYA